jgi:hypothetical protein
MLFRHGPVVVNWTHFVGLCSSLFAAALAAAMRDFDFD